MKSKILNIISYFSIAIIFLLIFQNNSLAATEPTVPTGYTGRTVTSETQLSNYLANETENSKNAYLIEHAMLRSYARLLCANPDLKEPNTSYYKITKIREYGWSKDENGNLVYNNPSDKIGEIITINDQNIQTNTPTSEDANALSYILYKSNIKSSIYLDYWKQNGKWTGKWKDKKVGWTYFGENGYKLTYYPIQGALWKELGYPVNLHSSQGSLGDFAGASGYYLYNAAQAYKNYQNRLLTIYNPDSRTYKQTELDNVKKVTTGNISKVGPIKYGNIGINYVSPTKYQAIKREYKNWPSGTYEGAITMEPALDEKWGNLSCIRITLEDDTYILLHQRVETSEKTVYKTVNKKTYEGTQITTTTFTT